MNKINWQSVAKIPSDLQADILKGLLEANGIPVVVSGESAGRAIGVTIGSLGEVDILVPDQHLAAAQSLLNQYENGELEAAEDEF